MIDKLLDWTFAIMQLYLCLVWGCIAAVAIVIFMPVALFVDFIGGDRI
jgi:hypothetical protein